MLGRGLDIRLLGSEGLTWRRAGVFCAQAALDPSTMLWRDLAGDRADWGTDTQLLASVSNSVRLLVWQNERPAKDKDKPAWLRQYPEPTLPPWERPKQAERPAVTVTLLEDFRNRTRHRDEGAE